MAQIHRLTSSPRGHRALRHLLAAPSSGSEDDPEMVLDARPATVADAFTGAIVLANAEHHLRRPGKKYGVRILPPRGGNVFGRFSDLLALPPERCALELPEGLTAPVREPRVLLPASRSATMEEVNALALFLGVTSQKSHLGDARLQPKEAGLLKAVLPMLAENAIEHAPKSSCGVVVCSALESDNREVQLVLVDLGTTVSESRDPLKSLRDAWARSQDRHGGIFYTTELARHRGLDVSLQIKTGSATARWRGRWHSDTAEFTPGWVASLTIHR